MSQDGPGQPYRRLPGDRYVRVPRGKTERVRVGAPRSRRPRQLPPQLILVVGFAALILVGWLLLLLPWATAPERSTSPVDALFTATSAVCVTGLVVVDTGTHWSPFGQVVILALIQLGGLGFMTVSTLLFLLIGHRVSLRERLLLKEALGTAGLGDVIRLALQIAALTFAIEAIGFVIFFLRFVQLVPLDTALWWSLFHAISSFNQAGFDLWGDFRSLAPFHGDAHVLVTTAALIILGGISFTVMADSWRVRSFRRLTLDSKLVLVSSGALLLAGTVALLLIEKGNEQTLSALALPGQLLDAFFLSTTARSAGFSPIALGLLHEQSLFLLMGLMFIGAASGSTGGGIRINTFSLLFLAMLSAMTGKTRAQAFGRVLPEDQIFRAMAVAFLAVVLIFVAALVLAAIEAAPFLPLLFDVVSAFGTVGLSVGVTPTLSDAGKLALALLMFVGRLGPITLVLALTLRRRLVRYHYPSEEIKIG